jgi:1,2-diacylglycerol 3-beta-galactosyltransferase
MEKPIQRTPRILFLFSDTGGGHRSAAEAIIEALHLEYGEAVHTEMIDIFKESAPLPLNYIPEWYPQMVRVPEIWGLGFRLSDGRRRARLITSSTWPYVRRRVKDMVSRHPSDLIVSVHPLANTPVLHALGKHRPPYITMVTDLVSTHALWYDRRTDLCLVPTEKARQRALENRLKPNQVRVVGLPVADRFCQPPGDKHKLRQALGWPLDLPMLLLVGGGEGMGPLERIARLLGIAEFPAGLAVITGRNQKLKERLEAATWPDHTYIYGFVRNMPEMMEAADILLTKAGPGTISEALNANLPMILYSRLPGQEDGNINYVVDEGAGIWAPRLEQTLAGLRTWLESPELLKNASQACRRLARPRAAREIAHILAEAVGFKP